MTIRTRLTLWYSSLLATVIVVFGMSLFSILNWTWRWQLRENMLLVAKQTGENLLEDRSTGSLYSKGNEVDIMTSFPFGIQVRQADGKLIQWSSMFGSMTKPFDNAALTNPDLTNGSHPYLETEVHFNKKHAFVLTVPVTSPVDDQHIGTIQVMSSLETIDAAMERLFNIMLGVGMVALLLSFMVGSVIAGQALQPIDIISQAAKQITAAGDLSKRIPYQGPQDELGQLTTTFNATLERLERLFLTQRRFVADVSHELRTPLTTIQGNLDLVKRYGNDPTSLEAIDSEVKRMSRLVGDLLFLAQADSGRLPLVETDVELGTLAWDVVRQARVLTNGVDLRLGIIDAVRVHGDEDRLKQLLLNLVTNALKYTPAGGQVTVSVTHKDGYAFLKVTDTGIGIPKEDLEHIFDRFYRVDKARSRQMGGTGLGLSIASWITEAHKGKIWAESEEGKGSTFTVQLPSIDSSQTAIPDSLKETRPRINVPSMLRRPKHDDQKITKPSKERAAGNDQPDKLDASTPNIIDANP